MYITDGSDNEITGYISRMDAGLTTRSAFLSYYPGSTSGSSRTYFNEVVAGDGFVVTAGQTYMNDLPVTPGAFDTTCGSNGVCDGIGPLLYPKSDGFIAVYSADLSQTLALTYFGGSDEESIRALELGADGNIYVSGETTSVDFPTTGSGADTSCGSDGLCNATSPYISFADGFIARLSPDLSQLYYSSYLGGSDEDHPLVVALDDIDRVYVAGYTRSRDFPTTPGAFDNTYNHATSDGYVNTSDAFISLIDAVPGGGNNQPPVADAGDDQAVGPRAIVNLDGSDSFDPDGPIVSYHWTQVYGVEGEVDQRRHGRRDLQGAERATRHDPCAGVPARSHRRPERDRQRLRQDRCKAVSRATQGNLQRALLGAPVFILYENVQANHHSFWSPTGKSTSNPSGARLVASITSLMSMCSVQVSLCWCSG